MTEHCAITHRQAMNTACDEAAAKTFKRHYQSMTSPRPLPASANGREC
jgi:hypothetical protein